ncbi:hypothetical protein C8J57DRAFT_1630723 [Mycena rebaudengoi]|nr:hypothetical protein C8J57DRAFT_1630723 [Mycena rebaudengoi]
MAETATELRAQLAKIGEDEAVLRAKLQLLAEERHAILRKLGAVVYPILTLPSDVTAEIFMHYLGNFPNITYDYDLKTYPPVLLASVCKAWRRLALSFPRLWASLGLYWHSESVIRHEQLLQCWLPRSRGCPIDLKLSSRELAPSICDTVAKYASQLRSLALSAQSASQFSLATQQSQTCFAALRKLAVEQPFFIHLPWNQLTILNLEDTPEREVLNQTPNLEVLSFSDTFPPAGSDPEDDEQNLVPLVMTKLHTLKIDSTSSSNCHFLDHLILPALRTLELGYRPHIGPLRTLIARSSCALQAMHLYDRTAEEIIDCLKLSESLKHITIEFGYLWEARFAEQEDFLEIENAYCSDLFGFLGEPQLPALKSLSFDGFPMALSTVLLQEMLESRRKAPGVANLESFRLVFDHSVLGYKDGSCI